jgi:hypothetical protein
MRTYANRDITGNLQKMFFACAPFARITSVPAACERTPLTVG